MTFAWIFAPVVQLHGDLVRIRDDVRVGEDVAVRRDDEARARAALRLARTAAARPSGAGMPKRRKKSSSGSSSPPCRHRDRLRCCAFCTTSTFTTAGPKCSTSGAKFGRAAIDGRGGGGNLRAPGRPRPASRGGRLLGLESPEQAPSASDRAKERIRPGGPSSRGSCVTPVQGKWAGPAGASVAE